MSQLPLRPALLVAVVEIGSAAGVLAFAVLVVTFVVVGAAVWLFLRGKAGPGGATTWRVDITRQLHVEKPTFDALASLTERALSRPPVTPATREAMDDLGRMRNLLARVSRIMLTLAGLGGIALSIVLFRQADSANMMGLPAGIILLLSLGALGSGLIPSRTVDPVVPLDPELFKNIHVQTSVQPLEMRLDSLDLIKAKEMLGAGASPGDVARAIYPAYATLPEFEKTAIQQAIVAAAQRG